MSVVVTGAAGFIGAQLVRRLLAGGHAVVGIDRSPAMPAGIAALVGDLAQPDDAMRSALGEADAVFHLAGCPGVRDRAPDVAGRRLRDNVIAGEQVLALTPAEVPLVVASSSSVYGGARRGPGGADRPCAETDELVPRGGYARSKAVLEQRCAQRLDRGGRIVVLRPFTVAGEGQRPDMALSLWIDAARRGEPLRVLGSPLRRRDVTDVRDVVEACVRAATSGAQGIVNVGTGTGHTLAELAKAVQAAVGSDLPLVVEPVSAVEPPATLADTRRCQALLGFVPVTDLPALVRRQAAAQPGPAARPTSHLLLEPA
jgi:nucleoside-diphosphate-sugar epimerase